MVHIKLINVMNPPFFFIVCVHHNINKNIVNTNNNIETPCLVVINEIKVSINPFDILLIGLVIIKLYILIFQNKN